ncbi:3-hydroxyacyl-CoA dehydrogenase NAD-binding domain-containing protein [Rhodospirillum centenum]|uniref:Peroxisomal bifunctional enzyme n=1 Tax=Rhodospirillum centenum (strain ATCC 51521 / SW) TaxID=414684 RepID=B6IR98_RHOCS|nr:3-hydroxyacyl-CoA dehydrogenase NAD-binding domain-containing protein [Rhodospirillum centenum]ACI97984.1 peroxisomal bifunctional enzyme [Rhodospirillum centenum SW]
MTQVVQYSRRGAVGVILVENPPVNALSQAVRQGLLDALRQGLEDDGARALVLAGGGRTFIAGADIAEFGRPLAPPDLNDVIAAFEGAAKPVVAAIHGTALGGGLEVALGCHYRVAVAKAMVGLPEVKLGILPGAGGTQRLPRLVGAHVALTMITSGEFVPAPKAHELGILDAIVEGDPVDGAVRFAEALDLAGPYPRVRDRAERIAADRGSAVFDEKRRALEKTARGLFAPQRCVDAVQAAAELPFEEGLKRERELFGQCMAHPQSAALIHVFFAERAIGKIPDVPADTPARPVATAAVLGAGTMGGGIAMNFANAGIPVTLLETSQEALDRGLATIARNYAGTVAKGRLTQAEMDRRLSLITPTLDMAALAGADMVVEAVFEDMAVKQDVFRRLDTVAKPGAVLATNTSTLDIDAIAAVTSRPADVIGMHFFSPANVMKLLEVVRGSATARDVIATAMQTGRKIGKVSVLVGNCDGFVGNRMLMPYSRQAELLVEEGAWPEQVDKALQDWGMAMGPFAMGDLAGVDVTWRIRQRRLAEGKAAGSPLTDRLYLMDRYGQKTGAGWFRYEAGSRTPLPDDVVKRMIENHRETHQIQPRAISDEEIVKRMIYALVNEGAKALEEGMALRASDIDVIYLYGYGFPAWRGGPMHYADSVGLPTVLADIRDFQQRFGGDWTPAPLLERLAAEGSSFAAHDRRR